MYDEYAEARRPGSFFTRGKPLARRSSSRGPHVAYIGNVHDDFQRYGPAANKVAVRSANYLKVKFNKAKGKYVWA